ncbi:MAG: hypothetical protein B6U85_03915 [Desulfurococcales archaeon ex4484_42]|nr:MAG: hypothetical protein B6U85_03915 [Desulfurococcales archaeon ex4484_42]
MAKVVLLTLGFEEKFAVRALVRRGLEVGDLVVLITGPIIDKVAKAINYVKEFLKYFEGIDIQVFEVSEVHEFTQAISKIKGLIKELLDKYEYMIINLSNGMRALVVEVLMATTLLPRELKERIIVELDTEDGKAIVEIPKDLITIINPPNLGVKEDIIKVIIEEGGEADIYTIAQKLGKDETTIRRQLETLKDLRLIELAYRPLRARIKPIAKAVINKG